MKVRRVGGGVRVLGVVGLAVGGLVLGCGETDAPPPDLAEGSTYAPGRLVIIGGGLQDENTAVFQAVLDGRDGEGPLCVFPTASAEPQASMEAAVESFNAVGGAGSAEGIFLTVDNPEDAGLPETVERIRSCAGFYFSGGVQTRIVTVFRPEGGDSPAFQALRERFEDGAVVSGSSAGAAIMSDPMIGGGSSEGALGEGIRWDEEGEGVVLEKGLGFLTGTQVDQHFLARGRWARLLVSVLGTDAFNYGAGIDENTALVVQADSAWVVGESGVVFMDMTGAVPDASGQGASGILLYLLGPGDGVSLRTGAVAFAPAKTPISHGIDSAPAASASALSETDLFERWGLLGFFFQSAKSPDTSFTFQQYGYRFEIRKGPDYRALAGEGEGVGGTPSGMAAGPLFLTFGPASSA